MQDPLAADWIRHLTQLEPQRLIQAAEELAAEFTLQYRSVPQAGLGMLRLREQAQGDTFNLGEFPVAVAEIELCLDQESWHGAAQVMHGNVELASALAIFDAILTHELPGHATAQQLLSEGQALSQAEDRRRHAMLQRTQVDFELLERSDHTNTHGSA